MSFETGDAISVPETIPAADLDKFRFQKLSIINGKADGSTEPQMIIEFEYRNDAGKFIKHNVVLKNEYEEDGVTPIPAEQRWAQLWTGFAVTDMGGANWSMALTAGAVKQILGSLGWKVD